MTIKQQGGVFGRNPTFNDVTIEGELTFDGDIDINSDLKIDGDLEVTGTSSLQNVGILDPSPTAPLTIGYSGAEAQIQINNSGGKRMIYAGAFSEDEGIFRIFNSSNAEVVRIAAETTAGVYTYFNAGNVGVGTTTPSSKLSVSGGNISVDSGYGIDFSATAGTGTSELFDDYEEGTFTPNLEDDAGNDYTGTYGYQEGSYTKIGNSVRFTLRIYADQSLTGNGLTGSEVLRIKSLPFIHANDNIGTGIAINNGGNFNYDAGYTQALSLVASNKSYIIFRQLGDSVTANNLTVTKCDSIGGITGFYAFVSGVYVV